MPRSNPLTAILVAAAMLTAVPTFAVTTYTYTNAAVSLFSGSFSVSDALADGSYSFASAASQPAGFSETFFPTYSYTFYGSNVTIAPAVTAFDVTITNGQVSAWNIVAVTPVTTLYTRTSNYNVGRPAIITDATSSLQDTQLVHYVNLNSTTVNYSSAPGVWSGGGVPTVPEPANWVMCLVGLSVANVFRRKARLTNS